MNERDEHDIELVKPREEAPKSFEPAEQPFDLMAACIQGAIVVPWRAAIVFRGHHRDIPEFHGQLSGLIAFIRSIHEQGDRARPFPEAMQQLASLRGIVGLARRQGKRQGRSSIRGNQMNLGGPPAAGSTQGLRTVFFNAPVPSGWTLTIVLSNATASIFTRMI